MARTLIVAIAALVAAVAAGCGSDDPSGPVRFLVFGEPAEIQAFRDVVRAYEERNDGADVELVEASDRGDLLTRLSTSIAAGTPPDVFLVNYRFYGQFASKGAIENVTGRLAGSDALRAEDFYPVALDAFRWRGEQACLPQNVSSLAVYYNRALFREQGVEEPRDGWTWNEMVAAAQALTLDVDGRSVAAGDPDAGGVAAETYGLGVEPSIVRLAPFLWSNGAELVDDDDDPTRLVLDTPEAQEALRSFLELRVPLGVVPSDIEVESEDDETRFANGRLAMLLSSRRSTPALRTVDGLDWDVAPLPLLKRPAGVLHSDAYCIAAGSSRKDAAWTFVEFALGPDGQEIVARTGRTVPSLIAVSRSPAFLDANQLPRRAQVFLDAIPTIRTLPRISTWPEIEDATEGILENGFYHGLPATEVARRLDEATRPLFARGEGP